MRNQHTWTRLIVAGGLLTSAHFSVINTLPMLLEVLSVQRGYSDGRLGNLAAAYSSGALIVALTSPYWIGTASLRLAATLLLTVGCAAWLTAALTDWYPALLIGLVAAGLGFGGLYALMLAALSATPIPERAFGWQYCLGSLPGVALLYLIPALAKGADAVAISFGLVMVSNLMVAATIVLLPVQGIYVGPSLEGAPLVRVRLAAVLFSIAMVALFCLYVAICGGWAFLGRVADADGIPAAFTGIVLGIATLVSIVATVPAALLGSAGGRLSVMVPASGLMILGLILLAVGSSRLWFVLGTMLFIGLTTFVLTYVLSLCARLETSGRMSALPAAILGAASTAGPAIAGHIVEHAGTLAMLLTCAAALLIAVSLYAAIYVRSGNAYAIR